MEKRLWTSADIHKLYRLHERVKSRQTLFNAEDRGEIPTAQRIKRGSQLVRHWTLEQLPQIGARYGFLQQPKKTEIICVYMAKGGVLKTTLAYCLARILALNGIRTLIVGLDIQCSITELALPRREIESLDQYKGDPPLGLYHALFEGASLTDVIQPTSLPTLDIIPETPELNAMEKRLRYETRREYFLKDNLPQHVKDYSVVVFDNGPNWSQLIENALVCCDTLFAPIGCDLGTYQALPHNLSNITEFQDAMKLQWNNVFLLPTLLEKTKLSQQIYGAYLNRYGDYVVPIPIRRAVKGQEALVLQQTPIEHNPLSTLAQDYYDLSAELWSRIIQTQKATMAA